MKRAQRILRAYTPSAMFFEADRGFFAAVKKRVAAALGVASRGAGHIQWEEHATQILRADERWIRRAIELRDNRALERYVRPMLGALSARKLDAAIAKWSRALARRTHASGMRDFVARYAAGEHERVWQEVRDLGPIGSADLREEVYALAVLTMQRVRSNVERVTERLRAAGYPFNAGRPPWTPPTAHTEAAIARIEAATRAPCPVALRAFWSVVGEVDFRHSETDVASAPWGDLPIAECDPLVLYGPDHVWYAVEEWLDRRTDQHAEVVGPLDLWLAPDHLHKANISGGSPYSIRWTSCDGDPTFDYEPHETTFIEYLRICFRDGGFSRVERVDEDERARAFFAELRRDLEPF